MSRREMLRGSPDRWQGVNCAHLTPDQMLVFFPQKPVSQRQAIAAKAICNGTDAAGHKACPMVDECLEWAIETKQSDGVWGGASTRERTAIRKNRKIGLSMPRKATGTLAKWAETKKVPGRLLPDLKQYLLGLPQDEHRSHDMIHVSELVKKDFCPRTAYYRISRTRSGLAIPMEEAPYFALENIYEEGHTIHEKWQSWFWDMGTLFGFFSCFACGWRDEAVAPICCPKCSAPRQCLQYQEVHLFDPEHLLVGHADGEIRDGRGAVLIEVKSIGLGTVRVELPGILRDHTRKYEDEHGKERTHLDIDGLWRDLKRPFPSHLRQGYVYLYLRDLLTVEKGWPQVDRIDFIYESKMTQAVKEFSVNRDDEMVKDFLAQARDVAQGLKLDIPPGCKDGKERCARCQTMDKLMETGSDNSSQATAEAVSDQLASRRSRRLKKVVVAGSPRYGIAGAAGGHDRPRRLEADEPALFSDAVG